MGATQDVNFHADILTKVLPFGAGAVDVGEELFAEADALGGDL